MAKKIDINKLMQEFSKSFRYVPLSEYDSLLIKDVVGGFYNMMQASGYADMTKWTKEIILSLVMGVTEQSIRDDDSQSADMLTAFVDISQAFLSFLADTNRIPLKSQEVDDLFDDYDKYMYSLASPEEYQEYDDPNLPQWLEYVSSDIASYTSMWADAYIESSAWRKRQKGVNEDILKTSLAALTDMAYNYYRKTPKSWTKKAIHGVLTGYFVGNIGFTEKEYGLVVPALTGLIVYVADQGWLNEKRAADYQRFLKSSESEMIELSKNPDNFGTAKLLTLKMLDEGIDIEDDKAVRDYLNEVNQKGGVDFLRGIEKDDEDLSDLGEESVKELAKQFDPDPKQDYLNQRHLPQFGSRKWSKKTAVETHKLGVEYATELMLKRSKYGISKIDSADIIITVCQIVDLLYAQHLKSPKDWETSMWEEFSSWLKETQTEAEYDMTSDLLEALMTMLDDEKIISSQTAKKIKTVLHSKVISLDSVRKKRNNKR